MYNNVNGMRKQLNEVDTHIARYQEVIHNYESILQTSELDFDAYMKIRVKRDFYNERLRQALRQKRELVQYYDNMCDDMRYRNNMILDALILTTAAFDECDECINRRGYIYGSKLC